MLAAHKQCKERWRQLCLEVSQLAVSSSLHGCRNPSRLYAAARDNLRTLLNNGSLKIDSDFDKYGWACVPHIPKGFVFIKFGNKY